MSPAVGHALGRVGGDAWQPEAVREQRQPPSRSTLAAGGHQASAAWPRRQGREAAGYQRDKCKGNAKTKALIDCSGSPDRRVDIEVIGARLHPPTPYEKPCLGRGFSPLGRSRDIMLSADDRPRLGKFENLATHAGGI